MPLELTLLIILGAALAGFVQGLSGTAFGVTAMAIWAWVLPPHHAVVLVLFGSLTGQLFALLRSKRKFNLPLLWPYLLGGLCGVPLGVYVLPQLNADWFRLFVAILLLFFCLAAILASRLPRIKTNNRFVHFCVGYAGGYLSSTCGLAGMAPSLWCAVSDYYKDEQRSIIQNFSLTLLIVTMLTYIYQGLITKEHLPYFGVILPTVLITSYAGIRLYWHLSTNDFRSILLTLLSIAGIFMLISAISSIAFSL